VGRSAGAAVDGLGRPAVLTTAAVVTAVLAVLALVVPQRLAAADWPRRCPAAALLLWQAVGVTAGLLTVQAVVTVALAPAGPTHARAVQAVLDGGAATRWWSLAAAVAAVVLVARLASVFTASAVRTLRARHRNRVLVDLVATRNPLLPGTRVVDHDVPLAYCLPGLRPRVVLSRGVLDLLREDEVRAVLAHEDAHVVQRHDLVVLPFAAFGATFPRLRPVRTASEQVALLVEMLADDRAVRSHPPEVLARALFKVGTASVPSGGLGATADGVLLRAQRLVSPLPALSWLELAAVAVATVAVLALPALCLLLPLLV
jgi:Zn-dependent protease with chaperone function